MHTIATPPPSILRISKRLALLWFLTKLTNHYFIFHKNFDYSLASIYLVEHVVASISSIRSYFSIKCFY